MSQAGFAANDVESEVIVEAGVHWRSGRPLLASSVQARGSVPLFWSQPSPDAHTPKPDITLQAFDPLFRATQRHFDDLRWGGGRPGGWAGGGPSYTSCLFLLFSAGTRCCPRCTLRMKDV